MLTYDAIVFDIVHVLRLFLHFSSVEALHVVCSLGPQNCLKVWPSLQFSTYTDIWWRSVTTRSDLTQVGPHSGCNPSTGMFLVDFPVLIGYPLFSFCCSMFSIAFGFQTSQLMNSGNHFVGARTTGWIIWWLLPLMNVLLANCSGALPLLRKKRLSFRGGFWRKTRLWVFLDSGSPSPRAGGAQFKRTSPRPPRFPKLTGCDSNVIFVRRDSRVRRISGHTRQHPRLSDARSYWIFFFGGPTRNPAKNMFFCKRSCSSRGLMLWVPHGLH